MKQLVVACLATALLGGALGCESAGTGSSIPGTLVKLSVPNMT